MEDKALAIGVVAVILLVGIGLTAAINKFAPLITKERNMFQTCQMICGDRGAKDSQTGWMEDSCTCEYFDGNTVKFEYFELAKRNGKWYEVVS